MARKIPALGPSDRSDTPSDRPGKPGTDSDSGGTGERDSVEKMPRPKDIGTDRIAEDHEVGLGGGLDQAEEARLKTDKLADRTRRPKL